MARRRPCGIVSCFPPSLHDPLSPDPRNDDSIPELEDPNGRDPAGTISAMWTVGQKRAQLTRLLKLPEGHRLVDPCSRRRKVLRFHLVAARERVPRRKSTSRTSQVGRLGGGGISQRPM